MKNAIIPVLDLPSAAYE